METQTFSIPILQYVSNKIAIKCGIYTSLEQPYQQGAKPHAKPVVIEVKTNTHLLPLSVNCELQVTARQQDTDISTCTA